jgi:hypothetical protein
MEIDCASLREIRLTSTRVYYFTELARSISTLFPPYFVTRLPAAAGISLYYFTERSGVYFYPISIVFLLCTSYLVHCTIFVSN